MNEYKTEQIRNIALIGHGGAGKTSLTEAMLHDTGVITRMGKIEDGSTVSDFDDEEIRRTMSLNTSLIPCEWKGHKLNLLDTPGYLDFAGDVKNALRVVEGALVLIDAVAGVEVGTELVWGYADERELPRMVVVSKMDRDNADYQVALKALNDAFDATFVPLVLPIGKEQGFEGVLDLISMKARIGAKGEAGDAPADLVDEAAEWREKLVEAAAEGDDGLIMKYFEDEELTEDEIRFGLQAAMRAESLVPVYFVSGTANVGVVPLMETVIDLFPSPADAGSDEGEGVKEIETLPVDSSAPLAALVFKTFTDQYGKRSFFRIFSGSIESDTRVQNSNKRQEERIGQLCVMRGKEALPVPRLAAGDIGCAVKLGNTETADTLCDRGHPITMKLASYPTAVYEVSVHPRTQADQAKMASSLSRLSNEDLTLNWRMDPITKETILSGMGEVHLVVAIKRAETRFGTQLDTAVPKVPYQETITKTCATRYRHKKQTGGSGQFAEVHLRVEPLKRGEGFEYVNEVVGGRISQSYIPSIQKGIKQVMAQGVIAGYPVVDVLAAVYDGKEHPVDSKDIAFQIAGREVFKLCVQGAGAVLLEPVYDISVVVPIENMGDTIGDLNTRRARVQGMDQEGTKGVIRAQVPLAEILRYANDLRSFTGGRGYYTLEFSHYETVPAHVQKEIVDRIKREKEEA
ncbi:MAG: elongation factor G [Ardenticatenales bacterium]|nr:elongation factor G [Ardenticatenales bacterium]